eukprot:2467491-Lingulodinium_polyedra.AAC.1
MLEVRAARQVGPCARGCRGFSCATPGRPTRAHARLGHGYRYCGSRPKFSMRRGLKWPNG